jgi:hypothetical protein
MGHPDFPAARRVAPPAVFLAVLVCSLVLPGKATAVFLNEILYSPKPSGPNLEFVEIYNEASEPVDLSGYEFTRGISYVIPYPTFVRGNGYLVVAADVAAVLAANPLLRNDDPKFPAVVGPFIGKLDDAGETVALANPAGAVVSSVNYNNRGSWPAAAEKTGHSVILRNTLVKVEEGRNWLKSPNPGGSPGFANLGEKIFEVSVLIDDFQTWRYLPGRKALPEDPDPPSTPVEAWRALEFNDAAWLQGEAGIGFDSPARPEIHTTITDMVDSYISMYFRKKFTVADKEAVDQLILEMGFDDGFIAYLNGTEVARKFIRAGEESYDDRALGAGELRAGDLREDFDLTGFVRDHLRAGENVLAVQVHNAQIANNDFGFHPKLIYKTEKFVGGFVEVPVRVNELHAGDPAGRWLELYNDSDVPVDLGGYFISTEPADLARFPIPAGRVIPARGYLVFTEAEMAADGVSLTLPAGKKSLWVGLAVPTHDAVVDAVSFQPPAATGLSEGRYPDGATKLIVARTPTRGAANVLTVETDVVINEIMYNSYHPFGDLPEPGPLYSESEDQGEYLELFNRSARTISLKGWSLAEAIDFAFPDIAIGPGEYLVVAKDPDWLAAHHGLDRAKVLGPYYNVRTAEDGSDVIDLAGGFLANDFEEIELHDELGNEVDEVPYTDSGRWPVWADGRGSSLELIDPAQDNSEPAAWDASDESGKAEWQRISYQGVNVGEAEFKFMLLTTGIVLVDNLSIRDPANPNVANFVPYGDFEAPLTAAQVLFGGNHAWSGRTTAGAKDGTGALRIVATGRGNNRADRVEINAFSPVLPNSRNLTIEFDAKWVCGEGVLLTAGYNHGMAKSHLLKVPERLGTPGRENSVRARLPSKNLGPIISGVRHSPVLPQASSPVHVRARISDANGVASAAVEWRLDGTADSTLAAVPLADDGQHEDGVAGDGVYGAEIPGQVLSQIVVYRVIATDTAGNASRFPADELQRTHPLRLDASNLAPASARTSVPLKQFLTYQHLSYAPDVVRSYRMIFPREAWAYLQGRPIMSNDLVDATFVFNDTQAYYNVGIRFGNSPWTRGGYGPTNQSYRVKFGKDDLFQGWRKFKLDNQRNENLMDERVAWYLFRGNTSPVAGASPCWLETRYCQPYVSFSNQSQRLVHIYDQVEVPGGPFLDKWWPGDSDGALFKMDDRFEVDDAGNRRDSIEGRLLSPPQGGDGNNKESYRWFFFHRTRDKYDSFAELMEGSRLLDVRRTPSATDFNAKLFQQFNVEQMARSWSINMNIDDWDTWGTNRGKNCFVYRPRSDGRWHLIPWDKDLVFGNLTQLQVIHGTHTEVSRILSSPNGRRVYYNVLKDMLDGIWSDTYINNFFSEVAKVAPAAQIGTYTRGASFIRSRAATIRTALGAQNITFAITNPAAEEVTQDEATITVAGNAPYGVWAIQLQKDAEEGVLLEIQAGNISWTGTRWTTAPISLTPGANNLTFVALDKNYDVLAEDQLRVIVGTEATFIRGDSNRSGILDLTDAIVTLEHLFMGKPVATCHDPLDADDNATVNLSDPIFLLNHLFASGKAPPAPYPEPGADPTADALPPCLGP